MSHCEEVQTPTGRMILRSYPSGCLPLDPVAGPIRKARYLWSRLIPTHAWTVALFDEATDPFGPAIYSVEVPVRRDVPRVIDTVCVRARLGDLG